MCVGQNGRSCLCAYLFVGQHGRPCAFCEPNMADIPTPPPVALTEDLHQNDLGLISYDTSGIELGVGYELHWIALNRPGVGRNEVERTMWNSLGLGFYSA